MNIKPIDQTIRELLISGKQFSIPRFQREYSWDKKNYNEFFNDMVDCLTISDGKLKSNSYFLGTMLFIGNYSDLKDNKSFFVVDGQQRITTITILFSALSDRFRSINEEALSEQVFRYIMTQNDDGQDVRILESKTHYPYFSFFIQDREKSDSQDATTEEEECIRESYKYLYDNLDENKMRTLLKKRIGSSDVDQLTYVDILKVLRDQVLGTTFISIITPDRKNANMIFEILNAKGKRLSYIDLIKNKIFETVDEKGSADFAEVKWAKIKQNLVSRNEAVGLATFFRHFWSANYKKSAATQLYDHFQKEVKPRTRDRYKNFLNELESESLLYVKLLNPRRDDCNNRKEYFWLVQSLNVLMNWFGIVQVRVVLLALVKQKEKGIVTSEKFKEIVLFLENFHFAYNSIVSGRANKVETIYSKFAIGLRNCENARMANNIVDDLLIRPLNELFPDFQQFLKGFIALTFSKKDHPSNVKTKYVINKLNSFYETEEVFSDNGSIEHIISEKEGGTVLNIGNLILLEGTLNTDAGDKDYKDKRETYLQSSYKWIKEFVSEHDDWKDQEIGDRAKNLADIYYSKILNRSL